MGEVMEYDDLFDGEARLIKLQNDKKPQPIDRPNGRLDNLEKRVGELEQRLNATDTDLDSVMQVCNL